MKLKDYLDEEGIRMEALARKAEVSPQTIRNLIKGYDTYLSVALRIESATRGAVRCKDLKPTLSRAPRHSKQRNQAQEAL